MWPRNVEKIKGKNQVHDEFIKYMYILAYFIIDYHEILYRYIIKIKISQNSHKHRLYMALYLQSNDLSICLKWRVMLIISIAVHLSSKLYYQGKSGLKVFKYFSSCLVQYCEL